MRTAIAGGLGSKRDANEIQLFSDTLHQSCFNMVVRGGAGVVRGTERTWDVGGGEVPYGGTVVSWLENVHSLVKCDLLDCQSDAISDLAAFLIVGQGGRYGEVQCLALRCQTEAHVIRHSTRALSKSCGGFPPHDEPAVLVHTFSLIYTCIFSSSQAKRLTSNRDCRKSCIETETYAESAIHSEEA